jgi:hypothetical protein
VLEHNGALGVSHISFRRTPSRLLPRMLASVALRTSMGSRRRTSPFNSKRSNVAGEQQPSEKVKFPPLSPHLWPLLTQLWRW